MGKKSIVIVFLFAVLIAFSQAPGWKWAKTACGFSANGIGTDSTGSCYVIGSFGPGSAVFGNYTLTGTGSTNMALVKYDSTGNFNWAKTISSSLSAGLSIKTDGKGNSYVLGSAQSSAMIIGSFTLSLPNNNCAFAAKYDSSGNVIWASLLDTPSPATHGGMSISTDVAGNSYIAGRFGSNVNDSIMFYKLNSSGGVSWKKYGIASNSNWNVSSLSNDAAGNTYIAGTIDCSSLGFNGTTITNSSMGRLIFVVMYNAAGNVVWAKSAGTYPSLYNPLIASDAAGNSYVSGYFNGNYASFGGTILSNSGGGNGYYDIFVVKFDNQGNIVWAKRGGGINNDEATGITNDNKGNIYLTGFFNNGAFFDNLILASNGLGDVFVVKYDTSGNAIWAKNAGGSSGDSGTGIKACENGNVYVSGYFSNSKSYWDNIVLQNCDTVSGHNQLAVARISDGPVAGIRPILPDVNLLRFFPNPASSEINFESRQIMNGAELSIYSTTGQLVRKINGLSGTEFTFKRGDLPCGIYFVRIQEKELTIKSGKLIISD